MTQEERQVLLSCQAFNFWKPLIVQMTLKAEIIPWQVKDMLAQRNSNMCHI